MLYSLNINTIFVNTTINRVIFGLVLNYTTSYSPSLCALSFFCMYRFMDSRVSSKDCPPLQQPSYLVSLSAAPAATSHIVFHLQVNNIPSASRKATGSIWIQRPGSLITHKNEEQQQGNWLFCMSAFLCTRIGTAVLSHQRDSVSSNNIYRCAYFVFVFVYAGTAPFLNSG